MSTSGSGKILNMSSSAGSTTLESVPLIDRREESNI